MTIRVTFWRVDCGHGLYGEGKTYGEAFAQVWERMSLGTRSPFLTGVSESTGERFGPDRSEEFRTAFAEQLPRIKGQRRVTAVGVNPPCSGWSMEIRKLDHTPPHITPPKPRHVARYAVTFGLAGCFMPDSHEGAHEFTTRRDLVDFIRDELRVFDLPKRAFDQVNIRRVWRFIRRHGSSSAHFHIHHGPNVLSFHGLTEEEYREHEGCNG